MSTDTQKQDTTADLREIGERRREMGKRILDMTTDIRPSTVMLMMDELYVLRMAVRLMIKRIRPHAYTDWPAEDYKELLALDEALEDDQS